MPLLDVEMVGTAGDQAGVLATRLADAAGAVFGSDPGSTWVRLRWLDPANYGENGGPLPADVRPVFVSVIEAHPPEGAARAERTAALANALADVCERSAENMHVLYEPPGAGRVAFGDKLVE